VKISTVQWFIVEIKTI